jgi:hypothetical protein
MDFSGELDVGIPEFGLVLQNIFLSKVMSIP